MRAEGETRNKCEEKRRGKRTSVLGSVYWTGPRPPGARLRSPRATKSYILSKPTQLMANSLELLGPRGESGVCCTLATIAQRERTRAVMFLRAPSPPEGGDH